MGHGFAARTGSTRVMRRLLIVDDHAPFRALARELLQGDGFNVIGEAVDGGTAVLASEALRPDVILLDVGLPDVDGFSVCEQLTNEHDAPAVVLTSGRQVADFRRRLRRSRARGFIAKVDLSGAAILALLGGD